MRSSATSSPFSGPRSRFPVCLLSIDPSLSIFFNLHPLNHHTRWQLGGAFNQPKAFVTQTAGFSELKDFLYTPELLQQSRNLIAFLSQTYEEALEAQKAKKEAKKPSKAKNSEANKKKKWKKSNKGDLADKNDAVSPKIL